MIKQGSREKEVYYTHGHLRQSKPRRRWRFAVRGVAIAWLIALTVSWLMGLGAVKLVAIIESFLRGS